MTTPNPLLSYDEVVALHKTWRDLERRLEQAIEWTKCKRYLDAAQMLDELCRDDPDYPLAHFYAAQAHWELGEPRVAVERMLRAVELGMRQPDVLDYAKRMLDAGQSQDVTMADRHRSRLEPFLEPYVPTLTLSMIVRNEERYLAMCLTAVRDIVDQIVVVDTGSTDNTVAIARDFGAEVYHFAWCDDFAAARNESLQYATGDWTLWLDADEELQPDSVEALRNLIRREEVAGAHLRIDNLIGGRTVPFLLTRLWRRHPAIRFKLPIHEQILWSIGIVGRRYGRRIVEAHDVILKHYGYLPNVASERKKDARNLHLLEMLVKREPENAYALFHYASALREQGKAREALTVFEKWKPLADATRHEENWILLGFANYVSALNDAARYEDAVRLATEVIESRGKTVSLLYQRATALHRIGKSREALMDVQTAERMPRTVTGGIETIDFQPLLAPMLTAEIYLSLGMKERARQLFVDAIGLDPNNPAPRYSLARLYLAEKDWDRAAEQFERILALKPDDAYGYASLAQIELFRHRFGRAAELLTEAARLDPKSEAPRMLAEVYLLNGDVEAAERACRAATNVANVAGCRAFLDLTNDRMNAALMRLADAKTQELLWMLVGKCLTLYRVASPSVAESLRKLAVVFAKEERLERLRPTLVRLFLKHRYDDGLRYLRVLR
jgi:glycosyltransferase involved in cell wall biosynthesis/Tfp pilus assembly protein PilF